MNDYVLTYTNKSISFKSDLVILARYMVFTNQLDSKKYLIIQLKNHSPRDIDEVKVELIQFGFDKTKLVKAHHVFSNLDLVGYGTMIPYEKIVVHDDCLSVQCSLIHAKSKGRTWLNGSWQFLGQAQETENQPIEPSSNNDEHPVDVVLVNYRQGAFPFHISTVLLLIYLILISLLLPILFH
jgi:hypothetical protein